MYGAGLRYYDPRYHKASTVSIRTTSNGLGASLVGVANVAGCRRLHLPSPTLTAFRLESETMRPLPVELWLKILGLTLHTYQPTDIPLEVPFIRSARARNHEDELAAQDKVMLNVLGLVCRSWREMCLSFTSM